TAIFRTPGESPERKSSELRQSSFTIPAKPGTHGGMGPGLRRGGMESERPNISTRRTEMPLPQDIRPLFQDIQDTLIRSEAPWIEQSPLSKVKVLWVGRETGTWASLHHWKKGYSAPPHKHLAGAHAFIISGKLQVR